MQAIDLSQSSELLIIRTKSNPVSIPRARNVGGDAGRRHLGVLRRLMPQIDPYPPYIRLNPREPSQGWESRARRVGAIA
jgi:hypothetical protein